MRLHYVTTIERTTSDGEPALRIRTELGWHTRVRRNGGALDLLYEEITIPDVASLGFALPDAYRRAVREGRYAQQAEAEARLFATASEQMPELYEEAQRLGWTF